MLSLCAAYSCTDELRRATQRAMPSRQADQRLFMQVRNPSKFIGHPLLDQPLLRHLYVLPEQLMPD